MNKAKTLKRKLGNPKLFLRVAWDTDDIPTEVCVNPYLQWKDIDWEWVEKNVFKLQKLIYKASSCGDVPMMRKYQKLLTKSYYARLLAVRCMIQENQGKKTVGIDGIKNLPLMQIFNLVNLLKSPYLKASRNYRVWTPKSAKGQKRSLGIPTIYYRALQALMELGMEPEWEARFEPNSYGFRPGRSTYDAIQAIYDSIKQKPKYVLDADISECMKRINHNALLGKLGRTPYRRLIKQWLKSGVFDNNQIRLTRERLGILQGEVISSLLANIALQGMEERINLLAKTLDARRKDSTQVSWQNQVKCLKLIPYADEFVVLHEDIKVVLQVKTVIQEWLSQIGLELKPEKTRIAHTLEEYERNKPGFYFLGFTIRQAQVKSTKQGFKTLIKASAKSIKTHYCKLAEICKKHKSVAVEILITKLNPVIRGWANYYSSLVSKEIFNELDSILWKRLWRGACSRYSNESHTWVKNKYFSKIENHNWILNKAIYMLSRHSAVPIVRHIKVQGNRTLYDGDWAYWSNRIGKYPGVINEVAKLLKSQKNNCTSCGLNFRLTV